MRQLPPQLSALIALCFIITACASAPQQRTDSGERFNAHEDRLILDGYDVVSYHLQSPLVGSAKFQAEYDGATYYFVNEINKTAFLNNPELFKPQYGAFCAYGMAHGNLYKVDPQAWTMVEGKLYLNINKSVQETWRKDTGHYIPLADDQWAKLQKWEPAGE